MNRFNEPVTLGRTGLNVGRLGLSSSYGAPAKAYEEAFEEHSKQVESQCLKYGWGYALAMTEVPFEDLILQVFRQDRFVR